MTNEASVGPWLVTVSVSTKSSATETGSGATLNVTSRSAEAGPGETSVTAVARLFPVRASAVLLVTSAVTENGPAADGPAVNSIRVGGLPGPSGPSSVVSLTVPSLHVHVNGPSSALPLPSHWGKPRNGDTRGKAYSEPSGKRTESSAWAAGTAPRFETSMR